MNVKRALSNARGFVRLRRRSLLLAALALYFTGPGIELVWQMPWVETQHVPAVLGTRYGPNLEYRSGGQQAENRLVRHDNWAVGLRLHLSFPSVRLFRAEVGSDSILLGFGVCESSPVICDGTPPIPQFR